MSQVTVDALGLKSAILVCVFFLLPLLPSPQYLVFLWPPEYLFRINSTFLGGCYSNCDAQHTWAQSVVLTLTVLNEEQEPSFRFGPSTCPIFPVSWKHHLVHLLL